jgi:hypothetical protein
MDGGFGCKFSGGDVEVPVTAARVRLEPPELEGRGGSVSSGRMICLLEFEEVWRLSMGAIDGEGGGGSGVRPRRR